MNGFCKRCTSLKIAASRQKYTLKTNNGNEQKVRVKQPRIEGVLLEERRAQKHVGGNRLPYAPSGSLFALNLAAHRHAPESLQNIKNRFPFQDRFELGDKQNASSQEVLDVLEEQVSPERWQKTSKVVAGRTFSILPVLEGINDKGNIGAIARSAEALGYGALHYIKSIDPSKTKVGSGKRTSMGSQKWMDLQAWDSTEACMQHLKASGYLIAATHLAKNAIPITELDWSKPTAVIMGNEAFGVSNEVLKYADQPIIIPQSSGFVDSFNVSVAAAVILYEAFTWRTRNLGQHGDLDEEQQRILKAAMLLRHKNVNATLRKRFDISLDELDDLQAEAVQSEEAWQEIEKDNKRKSKMG